MQTIDEPVHVLNSRNKLKVQCAALVIQLLLFSKATHDDENKQLGAYRSRALRTAQHSTAIATRDVSRVYHCSTSRNRP